jgi:hypothetical protein
MSWSNEIITSNKCTKILINLKIKMIELLNGEINKTI